MRHTLVLIHGTFAPRSSWLSESSSLRVALASVTTIHRTVICSWGLLNNSDAARKRAAQRLRAIISSGADDERFVLIAHSHGGNVAMLAVQDEHCARRVAGVVCLATPFISEKPHAVSLKLHASVVAFTMLFLGPWELTRQSALFLTSRTDQALQNPWEGLPTILRWQVMIESWIVGAIATIAGIPLRVMASLAAVAMSVTLLKRAGRKDWLHGDTTPTDQETSQGATPLRGEIRCLCVAIGLDEALWLLAGLRSSLDIMHRIAPVVGAGLLLYTVVWMWTPGPPTPSGPLGQHLGDTLHLTTPLTGMLVVILGAECLYIFVEAVRRGVGTLLLGIALGFGTDVTKYLRTDVRVSGTPLDHRQAEFYRVGIREAASELGWLSLIVFRHGVVYRADGAVQRIARFVKSVCLDRAST